MRSGKPCTLRFSWGNFCGGQIAQEISNDPVYGIARIAWLTNINKYYSASYTEILLLTVRSYSKFLPTIINNNMQAMNT